MEAYRTAIRPPPVGLYNDKVDNSFFLLHNCNFFVTLQKVDRGMATKEEVEAFLNGFHAKMKVFRIVFRDDRGKNAQTLAEHPLVYPFKK